MRVFPSVVVVAASVVFACSGFTADMDMHGMEGHGMHEGMDTGTKQTMMANPHHKLAMAYLKNLQNFAEALKSDISSTGKVDKDFATSAVNEMKQSLKQMEKHHKEMQKPMPQEMKAKMGDMAKVMDNRFVVANQHLDLLQKEVKAKHPDPKKVETELEQIVKQCEMMEMKGMDQQMK